MAPKQGAAIGIQREKKLLKPLYDNADKLIDTTNMSPHDLKFHIKKIYEQDHIKKPLSVSLYSFSYKRGIPNDTDMVIDCRFLKNPYWNLTHAHVL